MFRMIALFLVGSFFVLTGQHFNKRMRKRISSLKQLLVFIENINSQISFSKMTIQEIIGSITLKEEMKLKMIDELSRDENGDFQSAWRNSVNTYYSDDSLDKEDAKILLSFGNSLGVTDVAGQENNCRLHISMLEKQLAAAESNLKEKSKINTALSTFLALASVIIFY